MADLLEPARFPVAFSAIRTCGDPVLRMRARPVTSFDPALSVLCRRMAAACRQAGGVGIAAPQIGVARAVALIGRPAWSYLLVDGHVPVDDVVLINPTVVSRAGGHVVEEGCLSLPGRSFRLLRPTNVSVRACDETGTSRIVEGRGLGAQVLAHELDHLEGTLVEDAGAEVPSELRR